MAGVTELVVTEWWVVLMVQDTTQDFSEVCALSLQNSCPTSINHKSALCNKGNFQATDIRHVFYGDSDGL